MKFCAIADLHGLLPVIDKCDILLIAGDISPLKIQGNIPEMNTWLFTNFLNWIEQLPCEQVILVAGNHDFYFQNKQSSISVLEFESDMKLKYLHNFSTIVYNELGDPITIFGTPYCHIFGSWPFMIPDELLEEKFKEIPENLDILISHDPPFGICDIDCILGRFPYEHVGNQVLTNKILEVKPKIVISGHIHSGDHNLTQVEETKYVNVSLLDETYTNNYKPFYFEY